jgi:hypothetical protein
MNRLAELLVEAKKHVGEVYGTLDKGSTGRNIRHDKNAISGSRFAAFDPAKANSANILASLLLGAPALKTLYSEDKK